MSPTRPSISKLGSFGFAFVGAVTFGAALVTNRTYQDTWILQGFWIPVSALVIIYLITVISTSDLEHIALLTSSLAFLLFAVPALKYAFPYGSTTDVSAHTSLARTLALTGQIELSSSYRHTPGFHAVIAALSQISGLPVTFWLAAIPPLLGSIVPLSFYMLCKRTRIPISLARIVIVLSGVSLPLLYELNGTRLAVPLVICSLVFFLLRETEETPAKFKVPYVAMYIGLVLAIVFWHPPSSLVVSFVFLSAGAVFALDRKGTLYLRRARLLAMLGTISLVFAISYWMYDAGFIWNEFVKNISQALQPSVTPDLVPATFFGLPLADAISVLLLLHARDGIMALLCFVGVIYLLMSRRQMRFARLLRTYTVILVALVAPVVAVFLVGFGTQGYARFLRYVVAASPLLAGYGLWRGVGSLHKHVPGIPQKSIVFVSLSIVFIVSAIQLFPYQPAVPKSEHLSSNGTETPIIWLHQVNTTHQDLMLRFATESLPNDTQVIVDSVGYVQSLLFEGPDAQSRLLRTIWAQPEPSFILLHWPGQAGAYTEQTAYRSLSTIEAWRRQPSMSTIYDNGGSFVLYYPDNAERPFSLER